MENFITLKLIHQVSLLLQLNHVKYLKITMITVIFLVLYMIRLEEQRKVVMKML